ncbi:MAG TPA: HEAT repeat domain-containing protein [Longimicrobiales bacterium]|nr:HEAT repeat domain-containing protein [Longimicrobiales bacterium]
MPINSRMGVGLVVAALAATTPALAQQQPIVSSQQVTLEDGQRFATLPGFVVERVTPEGGPTYLEPYNPLAPDQSPIASSNLIVITFDAEGRPWVSPSSAMRGSAPQRLIDADGDGIYEAMAPITQDVNTCHGLWWVDPSNLFCVGFGPKEPDDHWTTEFGSPDNPDWQAGLYRVRDVDHDGVAESVERIVPFQSGMFDHGPHRVLRAADGSIQVILGNVGPPTETSTNLDSILKLYPERDFLPRLTDRWGRTTMQSSVVRVDTLAKRVDVVFAGYRNAVGFTWNRLGETFFFDSDMEPEIGSPWYRQIRSYHGVPNADYGFRNGSNKWPMDYFDILPPVRELNRGSPTGVAAYHAWAYPPEWRDVIFEADYSWHRILYSKATPNGATYTMRSDSATFVSGPSLPVTDIEVGPDGMLYFTLNGADGGLFRVRYVGPEPEQPDMSGIYAVTRQAQPLSSWGFAAIERVKESMGENAFRAALIALARDRSEASEDRFMALLEMNRHGVPPTVEELRELATDPDQQVRATVALLVGLQRSDAARALALSMIEDDDALVRRRAIEAVVAQGLTPANSTAEIANAMYARLFDPDRFVRYAARVALQRTPRDAWRERALAETDPVAAFPALLALNNTVTSDNDRGEIYDRVIQWLERTDLSPQHRLDALRMFEIAAWDRVGGAPAPVRQRVRDIVLAQYADQTPRLKLEMAKVLAYTASGAGLLPNTLIGMPETIYLRSRQSAEINSRIIDQVLTAMLSEETSMTVQMDYAYALRFIDFGWTPEQKAQMIEWFGAAIDYNFGGRSTTGFLRSIWNEWSDVLTLQELDSAVARFPNLVPANAR